MCPHHQSSPSSGSASSSVRPENDRTPWLGRGDPRGHHGRERLRPDETVVAPGGAQQGLQQPPGVRDARVHPDPRVGRGAQRRARQAPVAERHVPGRLLAGPVRCAGRPRVPRAVVDARGVHPGRGEHVLVDTRTVGFAGQVLDGAAQHPDTEAGIRVGTRFGHQRQRPAVLDGAPGFVAAPDVVEDRFGRCRVRRGRDDVAVVTTLVRGQHGRGDGRRVESTQPRGQHLVDRRVEAEHAGLDQLHEGQPRDGLGERPRRRHRLAGHRRAGAQVREPGRGGAQLGAGRHRDGDPGSAGDRRQPGQDGVERPHHVVEHASPRQVPRSCARSAGDHPPLAGKPGATGSPRG